MTDDTSVYRYSKLIIHWKLNVLASRCNVEVGMSSAGNVLYCKHYDISCYYWNYNFYLHITGFQLFQIPPTLLSSEQLDLTGAISENNSLVNHVVKWLWKHAYHTKIWQSWFSCLVRNGGAGFSPCREMCFAD